MELNAAKDAPGLGGREGGIKRGSGVSGQVVQHDPDTLGFGEMDIAELAQALGEIGGSPAVGDLHFAPGAMGVDEDEEIGRAVAPVLAVEALQLPGLGWRTSPMSWIGLSSKQMTGGFGSGVSASSSSTSILATYSASTRGMHHMSLRHGFKAFSARRRRTVSRERLPVRFGTQMNRQMSQTSDDTDCPATPRFTEKQGQYLAFIHAYTCINRRPPAEADLQRHFQVTPPSVHQMIVTLEHSGLIERKPGTPRSVRILVAPESLP